MTLGHFRRERGGAAAHEWIEDDIADIGLEENEAEREIERERRGMIGRVFSVAAFRCRL